MTAERMIQMEQNNIKKKYIKAVKDHLCSIAPSKDFMEMLSNNIDEFMSANPNCTYDDIIDQFGEPEDVAEDYLSESKESLPGKLIKKNRHKKWIIVVLVIALIAGGFYLWDMHMNDQAKATIVVTVE